MVRRSRIALVLVALGIVVAGPARAETESSWTSEADAAPDDAPQAPPPPGEEEAPAPKGPKTPEPPSEKPRGDAEEPAVHHAPVPVARAHRELTIRADITHPHRVRRAVIVYRHESEPEPAEVELRRAPGGPYVAVLPADALRAPALYYSVELEGLDGERHPVFASRARPHRVSVPEDPMDVRERALARRLGGRRSVVSSSAEYVHFGQSEARVTDPSGSSATRTISDWYYRIESAYTYRPLRTVTEFSVRLGVVRGQSPVPGAGDADGFDVGLNYGAPSVRLRLGDSWHVEGSFLTSVTQVGFSVGAGGSLLIGDPYGSKLVVGFETIEVFGSRAFSRVDVRATDRLILSPVIELTDMPHADKVGVRLLGEVAYRLGGGFSAALGGGYQAREAASGGGSGGLRLALAF